MCLPFLQKLKSQSCTSNPHAYSRLDSYPSSPVLRPAVLHHQIPLRQQPLLQEAPTMGNPSPRPLASGPMSTAGPSFAPLSSQHERLILELLPFKDSGKFHDWLTSPPLRGCWSEFCRDFLSQNQHTPEPDKARTAQAAKDAFSGRKEKYLVYHPDKNGWTAEDHHVRFIVQIVSDGLMKTMWSEGDWKKRGLEISKAGYEVLSFLRSTMVLGEQPPRYSA